MYTALESAEMSASGFAAEVNSLDGLSAFEPERVRAIGEQAVSRLVMAIETSVPDVTDEELKALAAERLAKRRDIDDETAGLLGRFFGLTVGSPRGLSAMARAQGVSRQVLTRRIDTLIFSIARTTRAEAVSEDTNSLPRSTREIIEYEASRIEPSQILKDERLRTAAERTLDVIGGVQAAYTKRLYGFDDGIPVTAGQIAREHSISRNGVNGQLSKAYWAMINYFPAIAAGSFDHVAHEHVNPRSRTIFGFLQAIGAPIPAVSRGELLAEGRGYLEEAKYLSDWTRVVLRDTYGLNGADVVYSGAEVASLHGAHPKDILYTVANGVDAIATYRFKEDRDNYRAYPEPTASLDVLRAVKRSK